MKVKDLIKELLEFDQDKKVLYDYGGTIIKLEEICEDKNSVILG